MTKHNESRVKRNVDDVNYLTSDLTEQPMRKVLRARKSLIATVPRKIREAAYRERAGIIAVLGSCLCGYPVRKATTTESGHEPWCPSEHILASMAEVRARAVMLMEYAPTDEQSAERHDEDGDTNADVAVGDASPQESQEA